MNTEDITEVLMKCYMDLFDKDGKDDSDMVAMSQGVMECEEITLPDIERPRSRCWKLSVPSNVKDVFDDG